MWWLLSCIIPYFTIFFCIWIGLRKIKPYKVTQGEDQKSWHPMISILIAVKNEETNIGSLLKCLIIQDYPSSELEVIVIDDHSEDKTCSVVQEYCKQYSNIHLLSNTGEGKKLAINTGLNHSSGELIVTTDADCKIKPGWLSTIAGFYRQYNPDLIIGPVDFITKKGCFGWFNELEFLSLQAVTAGSAALKHPVIVSGANLAFQKQDSSDYLEYIHPEIPSGDDMFLLQYIKKRKGNIYWIDSDEATVQTSGDNKLNKIISQRARWAGKGIALTDTDTILLALITLLTNLFIIFSLIEGIFNPEYLKLALCFYLLKAIPDLLILYKSAGMRNKRNLLWFFIPSELLYPFYLITISILGIINHRNWKQV